MDPAHNAAVYLGRLGGKSKSPAKRAAARENGRKGGRPRKERCLDCSKNGTGLCVGVGAWAGHPPCYGFKRRKKRS